MFKGISHRIALRFTVFVFLLLLVNGGLFFAVDFSRARQQTGMRQMRLSRLISDRYVLDKKDLPGILPPPERDRIRIIGEDGAPLFSGEFFTEIPFTDQPGHMNIKLQNDEYNVSTTPIMQGNRTVGFVQIVDLERFQYGDLPLRVSIYLALSVLVSALTYFLGLSFAWKSLKPAEETMARLEQFTQDASHELRTPLAALRSSLDLALKTGKHREGIESAKQDLGEVTRLVERLLEFTSLDQFHLTRSSIDFSSLLRTSIDRFQALANEKKVRLVGSIDPSVSVQGDGALLTQIISNLIANAIKFSKGAGGTVHIGLTAQKLTVRDEGIGIPPDVLPRVFNRFFQADASRARGGYGLGLALVKRIVQLHGWKIRAESEVGKGTTFTVTFA